MFFFVVLRVHIGSCKTHSDGDRLEDAVAGRRPLDSNLHALALLRAPEPDRSDARGEKSRRSVQTASNRSSCFNDVKSGQTDSEPSTPRAESKSLCCKAGSAAMYSKAHAIEFAVVSSPASSSVRTLAATWSSVTPEPGVSRMA